MGRERPKAFLPLGGVPLLAHTLQPFEACPLVNEILPLVPEEEISFCQEEMIHRLGMKKVGQPLAGGPERSDSVFLGLQAIEGRADIVLIHDGARPLVSKRLIEETIEGAEKWGAVVAALPAWETIKEVAEGREVIRTVDRRKLWMIQTPQAFHYSLIWKAYQKARQEGTAGTDDAMLVERLGIPVRVVEGSKLNIKVTTAEDLILADAILKMKAVISD
jgi:2-C-methyl-D-erythritol 4-phosphate cytidylyltransferase